LTHLDCIMHTPALRSTRSCVLSPY